MSEEEKSYIINQADLYLSGKSLREIAEIIGKSHITVRNNLTNKLKYADASKYEKVMEKILDNKEKTIEDETVRLRVLEAYRLLVEEGKTISEIATILDSTENTIYRDLTKRLKELSEIAPRVVTKDMVKFVNETLKVHSLSTFSSFSAKLEEEKRKNFVSQLYQMFPTRQKRINFLTNCILTFGLRLETLSHLLGKEIESGNQLYIYISNVFKHGMKHQQKAVMEFESFFERLKVASLTKDKNKITIVLEEISDKEAKKIAKRDLSKLQILTDEEILTILKYQIKYMLSAMQIETIFHIENSNYARRVRKLQEKYPKLVSDFDYLSDFYYMNSRKNQERR